MRYSDYNALDIFTDFNIGLNYLRWKIGTIKTEKKIKTLLGTIFALEKTVISVPRFRLLQWSVHQYLSKLIENCLWYLCDCRCEWKGGMHLANLHNLQMKKGANVDQNWGSDT